MSVPLAVAWVLAIVALIVVEAVLRARSNRKYQGAESWPTTQSTVEFVAVRAEGGRGNRHYVAELAYSYSVEGHYYSGFYHRHFQSEKNARSFVEACKGKIIPVQYKPENPEVSVMSDVPAIP